MFKNKTKFGHLIVDSVKKGNRVHVITERPNGYSKTKKSYAIGINYNDKSGEWGQGLYDFETKAQAKKYLNNNIIR